MSKQEIELSSAITSLETQGLPTAAQFDNGPNIQPLKRLLTYDADEWEAFIHEWVYSLKDRYSEVVRPTGPGDKGLDVIGLCDVQKLTGTWDNHQCKYYKDPLKFSDISTEIGKIIVYSYLGHYCVPRYCKFIAPKGPSTPCALLISNPEKLRAKVLEIWNASISGGISKGKTFPLDGKLLEHFKNVDFSIFSAPHPLDVLEEHRQTVFYPARFGGGLPERPKPDSPPEELDEHELSYTTKLFAAYTEHLGSEIEGLKDLSGQSKLQGHFRRSRESFYDAESLRVFVRDKTIPGTFESLQEEIFSGVIDLCEGNFPDGYQRVLAVTAQAQSLPVDAHPLNKSAFPSDKRGVCHQLANDDRLTWKK